MYTFISYELTLKNCRQRPASAFRKKLERVNHRQIFALWGMLPHMSFLSNVSLVEQKLSQAEKNEDKQRWGPR